MTGTQLISICLVITGGFIWWLKSSPRAVPAHAPRSLAALRGRFHHLRHVPPQHRSFFEDFYAASHAHGVSLSASALWRAIKNSRTAL